jgi:hypothetical protein
MNFPVTRDGLRLRAARWILAIAIAGISPALASPNDPGQPPLRANDLLRQALAHEKPVDKDNYYAWMDRVQKPRGSVTKLMVSTPQGILSRIVAFNDRAPTLLERQEDDERINRLLVPARMREKNRKQQDDQEHIQRLIRALPDAFHCDYASTTHEDRNLRLECSPDPAFSPPNYESQVLQGMKAVILIDREEKRVAWIEGTLFKDVIFGWGFLGRLNRGGHIEITQSRLAGGHWGMTRMQLAFAGRLVLVKPLNIEQTEDSWDYRPVPRMTVAQALQYLRGTAVNPPR